MASQLVTDMPAVRTFRSGRVRIVSSLGPLTSLGGVVWAFLQPYRLTFLHPTDQGFWWLVAEPPLLVIVAGAVFSLLVARPLLADIEEADGAA